MSTFFLARAFYHGCRDSVRLLSRHPTAEGVAGHYRDTIVTVNEL